MNTMLKITLTVSAIFISNVAKAQIVCIGPGLPGNPMSECFYNNTNWSYGGSAWQVRDIATGSSDTATTSDTIIAWNSATASAKAEAIPGCVAATSGTVLMIKDEQGTAATYNITITPASGTVEGSATNVISTNKGSVKLICDGTATNWMIM